jgi:hypothetical protein
MSEMRNKIRMVLRPAYYVTLLALVLLSYHQVNNYLNDQRFIRTKARQIVKEAGAKTSLDIVRAVQDYLKKNITMFDNAGKLISIEGRPFLRASARDVLEENNGFCGEISRSLIALLRVYDIQARRINLWGKLPHVVAEVDIEGKKVIVDAMYVPDLKWPEDRFLTLQEIISGEMFGFNEYSTINIRRLGLKRLWGNPHLPLGRSLEWFLENPRLMKLSFYLFLIVVLLYGRHWYVIRGRVQGS